MIRKAVLSISIFCAAGSLAAQNFNISSDLRKHVEYLASDSLQGRAAGSEGERKAASYIYGNLRDASLEMLTGPDGQDFGIAGATDSIPSANILGIVEGYDSALRNEYIVVGAHMDNVGTSVMKVNGRTETVIYPGADDNASGVAALIELARLASNHSILFRRSVIFVAFGAGEQGNAGAWYFVNRAFAGIGSVKAMVNLDMLGHGTDKVPVRVYSSLSRSNLLRILDRTAECPVVVPPVVSDGTFPQSDYLPFYEKGIPVFHFTTCAKPGYHSPKDTPDLLNYKGMERSCNYLFYFIKTLAGEQSIVDSAPVADDSRDRVYSISDLDKRPKFFNSDEKHFLEAWVYKYVKYPASAIRDGVKGTVNVSFIIEKNGKLSDVKVVKGVDERLDDEAVKVISISPKWTPGQIKGKPVRTRITVPVEFRLK